MDNIALNRVPAIWTKYGFHLLSHCELSLKGKLNVSEISNDDSDQDVHVLTLLHESVLIWSSAILTKFSGNIVDIELVAVKLSLISNSLHELLDLLFECLATTSCGAAFFWLNF